MIFKELRKKIIRSSLDIDTEMKTLVRFIRKCSLLPHHKAIDVGCGYGSKLVLLRNLGIDVLGIEVNSQIVRENLAAGFPCQTVDEFQKTTDRYDLILMSHIIEHFQPGDLLGFIDTYLDRLNIGGYLIIITPLSSKYFYEDFDHVKPYQPTGIHMVFGVGNTQVQYYSRNKLELVDIWFRKGAFKRIFARDLYLSKSASVSTTINVILSLLFKITFGFVGRIDGWMGLYKKI